ncbi:MAG: GGDEF domain-containing protein [Pseudobutyrivibrio sp.]|nr:GGDEF domain-containing protein [Pseudobutyrivibrio sp.]
MDKLDKMPKSYEEFLLQNRKYLNKSMLYVILTCIFTGPAIALGIYTGVFTHTSYVACVTISVAMAILFAICAYIYKHSPYSTYSSIIAIVAMNILLVYMTYERINVSVTWFLMPLLSVLLLDLKIYVFSCIFNFLMILQAAWLSAPFMIEMGSEHISVEAYFFNEAVGSAIESFIMAVAGYEIGRLLSFYYRTLIDEKITISNTEMQIHKQDILLESMSDMYDKVNYIDFEKMIEQALQGGKKKESKLNLEESTHSQMVKSMLENVSTSDMDRFLAFTDLTTLRMRMTTHKIIYGEFTNKCGEWYRLQYITVDSDENNVPTKVIFTTQNIDEEKKKEDHLRKIALTDELTNLCNRRCYDEDVAEFNKHHLPDNLCILSIDVNGLKLANDTKGHLAGDELINGAARSIMDAMESYGKLYRTGGDEFLAIIFTDDSEEIVDKILANTNNWKGMYVDNLTISIGVAAKKNFSDVSSIQELEKLADEDMYKKKYAYYEANGIDRKALYKKFGA